MIAEIQNEKKKKKTQTKKLYRMWIRDIRSVSVPISGLNLLFLEMFNKIQTESYHLYILCLYTDIKNMWHYHYKLKLSAFMALQSGLILALSTYSAWDLFTTCSVVVCSVPINVLQTTTKSKQNQTHPCQTTQQTHCAPKLIWTSLSAVIFHQSTSTALTTSPEKNKAFTWHLSFLSMVEQHLW